MPQTSPLDSRLAALHDTFLSERPPGADEDVHMLPAIVDHVIERCSKPGDMVFDPFAGFGTTIERAVALGRKALGIELLPERVDYLRERVPGARIVEGDARELLRIIRRIEPPQPEAGIDLILTSPPYMTAENHEADPLTAYEEDNGDYGRYLDELGLVAAQCARAVVPGGFVVWNLADIHHMGLTTHLIRDCARVLEQHLTYVGVTEIVWDRYPHDLVSDALLVFRRTPLAPRK
ncbi:site-specific DNA-methyltransferase [Paeniglutamicibacter sp. ABSL32-1]|uniref:DNA methyltransferase n=1 Tax=Paeniglutamicibacter quisquiliarum TaxID=2849498 RepID=UPI001C2CEE19|nr:DNA methyltransferase [Paeniglutamicibacter quisquiliarum]MBV1780906.1 site-specific DNA-methyltransferase [Paeniglutamicibacter quisquiliarum]